jgi:activator of 2-hydroxyglutaryl-CoA dehydratase/predicted nucleotide-binding protein (sugar kinase/HSP70/actin superfamily)
MIPRTSPGAVILGVDLGKVTTSLAWAELSDDGRLGEAATHSVRHLGEPVRPFLELYREIGAGRVAGVAATGAFGDRLGAPVRAGLPDEVAQERAATVLLGDGPFNVVRVGGSGYSVLTRDARGVVSFEANERCSAGTGETVEGLCNRLGRGLDEAVRLAEASPDGLVVTSRCAVFAKSELTHYANEGEDHGRLFRGLFEGVARNVYALFDRVKVDGPVVLVGHGALIAPLARHFEALAGVPVTVPPEAGVFEALGALHELVADGRAAAEVGAYGSAQPVDATWPDDPATLVRPSRHSVRALPPATKGPGSVVNLERATREIDPAEPLVLGLDLGSTGCKAALVALDGALAVDVYRRTDGNPVEAAKALVAEIGEMLPNPVVAVGLTGSGRDAAATVVRAAFPELGSRLTVENEIVAHATAAKRLDPDAGRSLSIVEIGGQDAKFINVQGGRILESDMNRVCSAGTGSFLEEQALAHGLDDIAQFGEIAARGERPPDLGQTCTVFVADVAAEALAQGFTREDIFAGLQYSVIRNHKHRVMGQRRFLERVFFQGKPATNPSLARTLAAVTGREVWVPPDPGAMGAIGIAQLATAAAGDALEGAEALDLARLSQASVVERREFQCRDRHCQNLCRVESATVRVGDAQTKIVSGGSCPKYDDAGAGGRKLPKDAPNAFRERDELLGRLLDAVAGPRPEATTRSSADGPLAGLRLGLPYAHYLIDTLPFFAAFFAGLGAEVEVLRADAETLAEGDRRCAAPSSCAPVKLLHGLTGDGLEVLFAPTFVNMPFREAGPGRYTCPMAQGAPTMVERALSAEGSHTRVLRPALFQRPGEFTSDGFRRELHGVARELGASGAFHHAYRAALAVQERYDDGLLEIGRRTLDFARHEGVPVLLVAGETHVLHEPLLGCGVAELAAQNGALALPVDCFPVADDVPPLARIHWASAGRTLRATVAAARGGDVFPVLVGAYGCGPNSMVEHLFDDLLGDYPHTVLESDGHGGKAGYVTRVQAFLHAVRDYQEQRAAGGAAGRAAPPRGRDRLRRYDEPLPRSLAAGGYAKYLFGHLGGSLGRHIAAAMRGRGMDADFVGPPDEAALRAAQEACSGKECLPYQLIWGALADTIEERLADLDGGRALFLSAGNGFQACRANAFPLTEQLALDRMGFGERVDVADYSLVTGNAAMMPPIWSALVAVDLLNMLRFYHLAAECTRGDADELFARFSDDLEGLMLRERPDWRTRAAIPEAFRTVGEVQALLTSAAEAYRRLPMDRAREADLRDVYLCGDLYLRVDEWGNDDLQRRLADLGLRVLFEPFGEFFELLVLRSIQDEGLLAGEALKRRATLKAMTTIINRLVDAVRPAHPWVLWHDIRALDAEGRRVLGAYPFGESIPTVGSALLTWQAGSIDGVVTVAPRGCGPALLAEAELRRAAGFPLLVVYNDGDPVDEARLAGFAWRLRSRPARCLTATATPPPSRRRA